MGTVAMNRPAVSREAVLAHNARAWDALAVRGAALARPAVDEAFGDPRSWLGSGGATGAAGRPWLPDRLAGLHVLCLAAGGGKHAPLYAAAGAKVTVVDLSPAMLDLDRQVARERKLQIEILEGSMDELSMLAQDFFDVVIHPVSTCYVSDVARVFCEVARVTRPGGIYVSQHKAPTSLQAGLEPNTAGRYELRVPGGPADPLPPAQPSRLREQGTHEFVHSLSALLGGICAAGFVIEDVAEPDHTRPDAGVGTFAHRAAFLPPYLRVLARRAASGQGEAAAGSARLIRLVE
jgi:SAM-dependent methyltransferase